MITIMRVWFLTMLLLLSFSGMLFSQNDLSFSKGKSEYGEQKWGLIKKGGKILIPFQYDTAIYKTSSLFIFGKKSGNTLLYGVTDIKGREIVGYKFQKISLVGNLVWALDSEGKSELYNSNGEKVKEGFFKYVMADSMKIKAFTYSLFKVYNKDVVVGDSIFSDSLSIIKNELVAFRNGRSYILPFIKIGAGREVPLNNKHLCVDSFLPISPEKREDLLKSKYSGVLGYRDGFIGVEKDGYYGFLDTTGKIRISLQYQGVKPFSQGFAPIKINGKWGFINESEELVIQPEYDNAFPFCYGVGRVIINNKSNFVGKKGVLKNQEGFDEVELLKTGNWKLKNKSKLGLADSLGRELIIPKYDFLKDLGDGFVIVHLNNAFGVMDYMQNFVVPFQFDFLNSTRSGWFFAGIPGVEVKLDKDFSEEKKKKNGK